MRIAILTLPLHSNYGGILQAFALQKHLEKKGHEVFIIEENLLRVSIKDSIVGLIKRIIKKYILRKDIALFTNNKINNERIIIRKNTDAFLKKHLNIKLMRKFENLNKNSFDAYIVGSDQVWRPQYFGEFRMHKAFLSFTKNWKVKRLAYAASFGTDSWEYSAEISNICKSYIQKFDIVTVRENTGVELCKHRFGIDSLHVLDPTMLLDKKEYNDLINNLNFIQEQDNLFVYILDNNILKTETVELISTNLNLSAFSVNSKIEDTTAPLEERIHPPVENWIKAFRDSKFIITDSFHACVFSIIYNKPFLVIGNKERGMARFESLLATFDFKERLIIEKIDIKDLSDIFISDDKWKAVNKIKKELTIKSNKIFVILGN